MPFVATMKSQPSRCGAMPCRNNTKRRTTTMLTTDTDAAFELHYHHYIYSPSEEPIQQVLQS